MSIQAGLAKVTGAARSAPLRNSIGVAVILAFAVINPLLGNAGWDFLVAYRGDTLNHTYGLHTWNPYPTYWLILPFALLPPTAGYLAWNLVSAYSFITAIRYFKGDLLSFSVSLPCFWIFLSGQFEGFLALGLVLA